MSCWGLRAQRAPGAPCSPPCPEVRGLPGPPEGTAGNHEPGQASAAPRKGTLRTPLLSVRPAHGLHVAGRQAGVIGETALEHGRAGSWMGHTAVGGKVGSESLGPPQTGNSGRR